MTRVLVLLLTYDDPECGGAADALVEHLQRDTAPLQSLCQLVIKPLQALPSGAHRDTLYAALQELYHVKPEDIYVIAFLKGDQHEEYRRIWELCSGVQPHPIKCQVLTHLASYNDVGLIIRNLVRVIVHEMVGEVAVS